MIEDDELDVTKEMDSAISEAFLNVRPSELT